MYYSQKGTNFLIVVYRVNLTALIKTLKTAAPFIPSQHP